MEASLFDIVKNEVQSLVNLVKNEAQYLCCYNSYAQNYDKKKKILDAKRKDMERQFQKGKGVLSFKYEAQQWVDDGNDVVDIDTTFKEKLLFRWCPNCWWQYRRGKELAEETQRIEELLERCNSNIVAGRAHLPDIKSLSPHDFIHFKSRESKFDDLMKVLQDGNCNMIGLQGLGGAGKTSMAKKVGEKLKEANLIQKFIFLVVSQTPDFKKIRVDLAKALDIPNLEEVKEEDLLNTILSKITCMDKKLLIILDDVWEKFDLLENLGIPYEHQHKRCTFLITTRNLRVCLEMRCQRIELQKLTEEEALDLFEKHAINNFSRGLKGMPQKIVKHCGGLPVAILAVARALNNQPISVWKDALKTLEDGGVDPNLEEAYKCLKLSYDNLKKPFAKELLLVSSMFPEDSNILIKFLIKIGIGLGSFHEDGKYHLNRREVDEALSELVYSSLLLNDKEKSVKMHDLVREVALKICVEDIQSVVNLKRPIKGNLRYLFWNNDRFPDKFDGNILEVLSLFLNDSEDMNVSHTFFKEMVSLKVLVLFNAHLLRTPAPSLANALQPLKDIRTLILGALELGDISVLGKLLSLRILWLYGCSIYELPREFWKLNKLKSLEVEHCKIEKNNPFEVIEYCSQLEELTFVANKCDSHREDEICEQGSPLTLHRYCISSVDLSCYIEKYGSMSRCFLIDKLSHFISDSTFKQLVLRAELLILEGEDAQKRWKNLIPDIVPIDEGGILNDLIVLHLSSRPNLECLVDTKDHESGVTAFCNLAELHMFDMNIEDLCQGPLPSSFLERLEIMKLKECHELKRMLLNGNYNLCYLKTMKLEDCPKLTSVFQPSTARSLEKLEELTIRSCNELENIIAGQDGDSNQKSHCDSLLPKLKILQIAKCNKLRIILPILFAGGLASLEKISIRESEQVEYIFDKLQEGEDAILPSLRELELSEVPSLSGISRENCCSSSQKPSPVPISRHNSNKINQSPFARAFSWVQACCSLNKLRHASDRSLDRTNPPGPPPSSFLEQLEIMKLKKCHELKRILPNGNYNLCYLKTMKLEDCPKLTSVFQPSTARSLEKLEELTIRRCNELEYIVASEDGDNNQESCYGSLFPKLKILQIACCDKLRIILPILLAGGLASLEKISIWRSEHVEYIFDKFQEGEDAILPSLRELDFSEVPSFTGIFREYHRLRSSSMQKPSPQHNSNKINQSPTALAFSWFQACCSVNRLRHASDRSLNHKNPPEGIASTSGAHPLFYAAQSLPIQSLKNIRKVELENCESLISVSTLSIAASTMALKNLTIRKCHKLKCIIANEEDAQADKNYRSIFPILAILKIEDCKELEFLFVTTSSVGLENLKSLTIKEVPKLKYVVGNYQKEQHSFNQNHVDELHFDLLALETLHIEDAPKMNSICDKNYKLFLSSPLNVQISNCGIKSFSTQEGTASTSGAHPLFYAAQSLPIQSLKNIRKVELENCESLISVSTLSIAASTMALKNLTIRKCHKLKCIIANEEDAQADKNYRSIFPILAILKIEDCKELEFLFVTTSSVGLENLKSLTIKEVPKLKYVVGNYQKEQHSFNQNHVDELHFDLLALETLHIEDAPKMNSICDKNYKLFLSSPLNVQILNCGIKSFSTQEGHASTNGGHPLFYAAQSLPIQSLKNIRKVELENCESLISVSTLSIVSTILLEDLKIKKCHRLKCIVAYEGDAGIHMNYNSIFPKLKELQVLDCDAVEYLFPVYAFRSPLYLESLSIQMAPILKYVFGRSQDEDILIHENQIKETHIDFPSLSNLSIMDVPQLESIFPPNYYLRGLALRSIALGGFPMFPMRPRNEFLVFWHTKQLETKAIEMQFQTLEKLEVDGSKVEEIFYLTHVDDVRQNGDGHEPLTSSLQGLMLRNLCELENICVGPKHIMCFHSLQKLSITSCRKLKVIFSASMVRSLPMLKELDISECEGLVHFVEEDNETNVDDHLCHEKSFPNLEKVSVKHCDNLKYLFCVTLSDILPKLRDLDIRNAYDLEHLLIRRGEMKEMVMKDVLPQLRWLTLEQLPNLSVCHGIDFQTLVDKGFVYIEDCPNFSLYETLAAQLQIGPESVDLEAVEKPKEKLSSHQRTEQHSNMGDAAHWSLTKQKETGPKSADFEAEEEAKEKLSSHQSTDQYSSIGDATQQSLLKVLPERDNTEASAKSFEDEEEEQETTTTPHGSKNQDFQVWDGTNRKLSSHSIGRRALEIQQSTTGSFNFTRSVTKEDAKEIVEEDIIFEKLKMTNLSSDSYVKGQCNDIEVNPSVINRRDSQKLCSKNELVGNVARNERRMIDAQQSTKGTQSFTKGELVDKEVKKETNMVEQKSREEITRHDIQSHEEEKPEGDLIVSYTTPILSEQTSEAMLSRCPVSLKASTGLDQTPQATLGKPVDVDDIQVPDKSPSNLKQMEQESSSCSRGQIEHHDVTIKSDIIQALNVDMVQKIVEMMKLEGSETCLLEEALNTHPQLCLSINDRSTQMLCISYRLLIDILSTLTTRTPITITEAEKRLLEEKLKDARLLGFDKDWLESIETKVFNCDDISEVDGIQEILKGLESDLKSNQSMLAATRNQEVEAARVVGLAQKDLDAALHEHANVMAKHSDLLKARQHILARQNQYWEMVSAENKAFGF